MSQLSAASITARLDRLPSSRHVWKIIILLSLGGCFEFYDLFFTAYVAPGLTAGGMFSTTNIFGFAGFATFVAALFAGLFVGTLVFGFVADKFGRRTIFTFSLLWYTVATVIMAFQYTALGIDLWRFIAGIGIGVELVTIDTYVSELTPKHLRGRAFAFNQFITFLVVPVVAFLSYLLVPTQPLGLDGWRWVVLIGSVGAVVVWWIRLAIPESPRWLIQHGRLEEADRITAAIEAAVAAETGPLPPPAPPVEEATAQGSFAEIWQPPYRRRTVLMSFYNLFQAIGYYGFASWVPTLLIAKGIHVTQSLEYAFIIAIANPVGPLLGMLVADRMERKWQIVIAAASVGIFGVLFSLPSSDVLLILCGVLLTLSNNWMSFAYHSYQAELFPTRVRARAVGFVYSWSRLSVIFGSFIIAFFLKNSGVPGVFLFIAFCMLMVVLLIGIFGPRTRNLALEEISH
ncbi:MAG: MFS transporter [Alphaproteobacteria bacterium]|nr:MFS transporter [Alphaproteobacteria bacterium]